MTSEKIILDDELIIMHPNFMFETYNIKGMKTPVVCSHCGETYDLSTVKVNHRYIDCDQFTTPCCNYKFADNRQFKSFKDYRKL